MHNTSTFSNNMWQALQIFLEWIDEPLLVQISEEPYQNKIRANWNLGPF